jgi:hypothetical protein
MRWYETIRLASIEGWHASFGEFDKFERTKDIGFHFGTKEQADYFTARPYKKKFLLDINNPIRAGSDWNQSDPEACWGAFFYQGGPFDISKEETWEMYYEVRERIADDYGNAYKIIRDKLLELGYDGIVYPNDVEGHGDSYVAFSTSQITLAPDQGPPSAK